MSLGSDSKSLTEITKELDSLFTASDSNEHETEIDLSEMTNQESESDSLETNAVNTVSVTPAVSEEATVAEHDAELAIENDNEVDANLPYKSDSAENGNLHEPTKANGKQKNFRVSAMLKNIPQINLKGYLALEDDILKNGLLIKPKVYNNEIIDGRARIDICRKHKIIFDYEIITENIPNLEEYIDSIHYHHKDITPSQRAIASLEKVEYFEKLHDTQRKENLIDYQSAGETFDAARIACKYCGASYGMYAKAKKLRDDTHRAKLYKLVKAGKINLDTALSISENKKIDNIIDKVYSLDLDMKCIKDIIKMSEEDKLLYNDLQNQTKQEEAQHILDIFKFKNYKDIYKGLKDGSIPTIAEALNKKKLMNLGKKQIKKNSHKIEIPEKLHMSLTKEANNAGKSMEEFIDTLLSLYKQSLKDKK